VSDNPAAPAIRSMVAEIVSSYIKKNQIAPADIPALINTVYLSLLAAGKAPEPEQNRTPAVSIRQSVRPNYVVCLECGKAGQDAAPTSSGHTRAERRTVSGQMEAVPGSPTHRASLFRTTIQPREAIRARARRNAPGRKATPPNARLTPGFNI